MRIAAIVPCLDEEAAVGRVVDDLRTAVPSIEVVVVDNDSSDHTAKVAAEAGATVRHEPRRGKGHAVRRALGDVDADCYLMIDGDGTYDASAAPELLRALVEGPYDQVVAVREATDGRAYRSGHAVGNAAFARLVSRAFDVPTRDLFSGYRAFSRRFVRTFPAFSTGFEIETELTVHASHLRIPVGEVVTRFDERGDGGVSKLRTVRDGFRVLRTVGHLWWLERPVLFHTVLAALFATIAIALGVPIVDEFLRTGVVPRLPTALIAVSLGLVAVLAFVLGVLLSAVKRTREQNARLMFLAQPPPPSPAELDAVLHGDGADGQRTT